MILAILKHIGTVLKHKWYVGRELIKYGLWFQALFHDISKFSPVEIIGFAMRFHMHFTSSFDAEKAKTSFAKAWYHHKKRNKHHWQYWVSPVSIESMPPKYVIEMFCDWIGALLTPE